MLKAPRPRQDDLDRLENAARRQGDLSQGLRQLRESSDWQVLRTSMLAARQKVMETHTRALLKGVEVNQRQLDYDRGYWDGIIQLLEAPHRAEEAFQQTLERIDKLSRSKQQ